MEFNFPFPSLQQLSIIAVCQHWSDNNLGLFSKIRERSTILSNNLYSLFRHYSYMVNQLPIPPALKPAVSEVLVGICKQIHSWALEFSKFSSLEKFYFDLFGRFDIDRTVAHFCKNQVAATQDLYVLYGLLLELARSSWLSEIDLVLRKIVAVVIQPMAVPLEGPSYEVQNGKLGFVMHYRFHRNLDSITADKLDCLTSLISQYITIDVNESGLVVKLNPWSWGFKSFQKLYSLHESSERGDVARRFILDSFWPFGKFISTSHLLQALTLIEKVDEQKNWISYAIRKDAIGIFGTFDKFLEHLHTWPFTTFFAPACQLLNPHFETHSNRIGRFLFPILENSLHEQGCVALHFNLLRELWSSLSEHAKQHIVVCHNKVIVDLLVEIRGREESGKETISICDAIISDLDSLEPGNVPSLQRKRLHEGTGTGVC